MDKIEINGKYVNVLAEGINYMGRTWIEIEEFPVTTNITCYDKRVRRECEDWVVIEDNSIELHMNNDAGYIVLLELEKVHYEDKKGLVLDKPGRILYSVI